LCVDRKALVDGAPGSSSAPPHCRGGGSTKNKAMQILAKAFWAISTRMRHSFVDMQYSPSIGMDRTECEIIFEELTYMGFLVKQ
jgi:hypothetical protein